MLIHTGGPLLQHFDNDYVEVILRRLNHIPDSAIPRWGRLRKHTLIEHLIWSLRHSMGRSQQVPYLGNWFARRVMWPLFYRHLLPVPRNLQLPLRLQAEGVNLREPGDLETLHALLEEYLLLVQADELRTAFHPVFGDIGVDGWDRVHVRHFEHHLRQFGV